MGAPKSPTSTVNATSCSCSDDLIADGDESAEYGLPKIGKRACNSISKSRCDRSNRIGKSFESLLKSKIFESLRMFNSSPFGPRDTINGVISGNLKESGWGHQLWWRSSVSKIVALDCFREISQFGLFASVPNSSFPPCPISPESAMPFFPQHSSHTHRLAAGTNPFSHTSNPANSVGHPWVIYRRGQYPQTAVSSCIGIVPEFQVGFGILDPDETGSPDLNALADIIADVVFPAFMQLALTQATESFGGKYEQESSKSSITIAVDLLPGRYEEK
ncbi:beta-lactamase [Histoplasma capsulatum]|uniref:Beta-lactamase n=1 Tax=Ajellomyces capsulatus TaxID=5037 RepID=A0A8A1M1K6_AJECA|nr:beta-lactamase [Histoplasma capsulatum]